MFSMFFFHGYLCVKKDWIANLTTKMQLNIVKHFFYCIFQDNKRFEINVMRLAKINCTLRLKHHKYLAVNVTGNISVPQIWKLLAKPRYQSLLSNVRRVSSDIYCF